MNDETMNTRERETMNTRGQEKTTTRGRPKKKPGYDREAEIEDLITTACELFSVPLDDREERDAEVPSIASVAEKMNTTLLRVRKLLISGGMYTTSISRTVQEMTDQRRSVEEIMDAMHLSKASVYSYLPYSKGAYNLADPTLYSEQGKRYRSRRSAVAQLHTTISSGDDCSLALWKTICAFEGYTFQTSGRGSKPGVKFKYEVSRSTGASGRHYDGSSVDGYGNELWITTIPSGEKKRKSISRSTVDRAFSVAQEKMRTEGCVKGPKKLGVPGAGSYLYAIFVRLGVINTPTPTMATPASPATRFPRPAATVAVITTERL